MKRIFFVIMFAPFLGSAQNDNFNGVWKQDYSEVTLNINLNQNPNRNILIYNPETNNSYTEKIISITNDEILAVALFDDNSNYSSKYILKANNELHCYIDDYLLVYKKQ